MRVKIYLILISVVFLVLLNIGLNLAQEEITPEGIPAASEQEVQWVWGEIVSVDTQNKTILLKYLDYETETEKEMSFNVDDKTTYENIKNIDELKPKDTVSIDYVISSDGKNIAKNVSVERPESQEIPEGEIKPEEITPPEETPKETLEEDPKAEPGME